MVHRRPGADSLADSSMGGITPSHPEARNGVNLAKIRHDLRTPINHIIGYAEIIREEAADKLPATFVTDLGKIHSAGIYCWR